MTFDTSNEIYRKLILGIDTKIPLLNGCLVKAINFDNAATTPPFISVLDEIIKFSPWYSSVHRGTGYKSMLSSNLYDDSRILVSNFVKSNIKNNAVIYFKNTTEAINNLSNVLYNDTKKNVILSTSMEHHSNDLPWRNKFTVDYIKVDANGRLSIEDLKDKLEIYQDKIKLVTITGASNVTGYINPIYSIAKIVHSYGAEILVDGAQAVPHLPIVMGDINSPEHIDYLAFSAHKMYAPFGIGVLIGPKETFLKYPPDYCGGGTVKLVTHDFVSWDDPPEKQEAGSPNIIGVIALAAAINTLNNIGMVNIENYEKFITKYALMRMQELPGVILYSDTTSNMRVGIIPFNLEGIKHDITAKILSYEGGIAVRNGCFCAQPYVQKLLNIPKYELEEYKCHPDSPRPGMVRVSFGLYNTIDEIDTFISVLKKIMANKKYYIEKYSTL